MHRQEKEQEQQRREERRQQKQLRAAERNCLRAARRRAREERAEASLQRQAAARAQKLVLLRQEVKNTLQRLCTLRERFLQKAWGVKALPDGLVLGKAPGFQGALVCAQLRLQNGSLCTGPLRKDLSQAKNDLRELSILQRKKGDEALRAELQHRELEAMTTIFMSGPSRGPACAEIPNRTLSNKTGLLLEPEQLHPLAKRAEGRESEAFPEFLQALPAPRQRGGAVENFIFTRPSARTSFGYLGDTVDEDAGADKAKPSQAAVDREKEEEEEFGLEEYPKTCRVELQEHLENGGNEPRPCEQETVDQCMDLCREQYVRYRHFGKPLPPDERKVCYLACIDHCVLGRAEDGTVRPQCPLVNGYSERYTTWESYEQIDPAKAMQH
eukprot:s34_g8.t1